jgi:hypothetical protein
VAAIARLEPQQAPGHAGEYSSLPEVCRAATREDDSVLPLAPEAGFYGKAHRTYRALDPALKPRANSSTWGAGAARELRNRIARRYSWRRAPTCTWTGRDRAGIRLKTTPFT